jgi:hypothetical protein
LAKKWFLAILVIAALGLVVAVSMFASNAMLVPFGGPKISTPPTSSIGDEGPANSTLTRSVSKAQVVSSETSETLEQPSASEEQSDLQLSSVNFTLFDNSSYGIELQYPSNWQIDDVDTDNDGTIDIAGFISPFEDRFDLYKERLWLSLDTVPDENLTLEQYSHQVINHDGKHIQGFRLLYNNSDNSVLAGHPAYRFVNVRTSDDGTILKQMEIGTKIGNKVYYLDYFAQEEKYAEFLPIIQEMINSFQLKR